MESAKQVAAAAQSAFGGKTDSIDKGRMAGAAEDLLGAAESYGKLEGTGIGQYVDKAEDYPHKYHSSNSDQPTTGAGREGEEHAPISDRRREEESGSGVGGDYLKMAKGFFK